jgi:hypothetical protein
MTRKIDPKKIDEIFNGIEIPTDEEAREQTRCAKISISSTGIPHSEETKNKLKNTYSTDSMRAVQASKSKPHTEEAIEKIRNANLGLKHDKERVEKMARSRKGQAVYHKPFVTPSGAFPSKKAAIEWATDNGVRNAAGKFDKWIKQRPTEFYYITADEYEKIKDDLIITGLPWMENTKRFKKYRDV